MILLKFIFLYPVSVIYGLIVKIRNFLFDNQIIKSKEFHIPVISVGNITVGGTGKTPVTEYLVGLLKDKYNVAVLSRGYKRKTKGFIIADKNASAETIGDEPYQIFLKFPDITVAVDEKRARGIENLLNTNKNIEVIILDDAFQHRYVRPSLSILVIDFTQGFFKEKYLPYGRLRDNPEERFRAEIVLVTKTPEDVKPIDMRITATDLKLKSYQSLHFASINYNALLPVFNSNVTPPAYSDLKEKKYTVFVVTGIGNPKPVFDFCRNTAENVNIISFKDHHGYTEKDIYDICKKFNNSDSENKIIITTEKDAVKLRALNISDKICKDNFFYCPVNIKILNNEKEELDNLILRFTEKSSSQYRFLTSKKKY